MSKTSVYSVSVAAAAYWTVVVYARVSQAGEAVYISGASVYMDGALVGTTGASGSVTIPSVPQGTHTFRATHPSYSPSETSVMVDGSMAVTLWMSPLLAEGWVTVRDATTFGPILQASVYVDGTFAGTTGSDGRLYVRNVQPGTRTFRAEKSYYQAASVTVSVPAGFPVFIDLLPSGVPPTQYR